MVVVGGRSASEEDKAVAGALIQMTAAFCREFLNEEYTELCHKLATALAGPTIERSISSCRNAASSLSWASRGACHIGSDTRPVAISESRQWIASCKSCRSRWTAASRVKQPDNEEYRTFPDAKATKATKATKAA